MLQYVTIQHAIFKPSARSKMESLWQKLGNGWKLLLTVVTESFVLNVTGFLDPTLKCIDLDQGNKLLHLPITCSKSAKNTLEHVTVNNTDTRTTSGASIVNFEHILLFILQLMLLNLNKSNKCQLGLRNGSLRQKICFQ